MILQNFLKIESFSKRYYLDACHLPWYDLVSAKNSIKLGQYLVLINCALFTFNKTEISKAKNSRCSNCQKSVLHDAPNN